MAEPMRVTLTGVGVRFGAAPWLFGGVDLTLTPGDLVGVTGPSGSGKSTLLSVLARELRPTAGEVTFQNTEHTGWVFQNPYGVAQRSALDHVVLPLIARGERRRQAERAARTMLERFRLGSIASQPFSSLSGGEGQRLQLARAVAVAPDLLLVDEPTAQLDTHTAAEVNAVLGELAGSGSAVIIATHDRATAAACSRVVDLLDYQVDGDAAA